MMQLVAVLFPVSMIFQPIYAVYWFLAQAVEQDQSSGDDESSDSEED